MEARGQSPLVLEEAAKAERLVQLARAKNDNRVIAKLLLSTPGYEALSDVIPLQMSSSYF